ncbi:MAG: HDOD domain-containing protein [Candidatus Scalindua sediminis]|nr:HDOD domain-containing protein [Candidatus Scalindua sediminis]
MRRILFVDDHTNVLQGYKRMLRPMRHEWEMEFAMSGEEALNFMSKSPFDVIVSDMRMPGMDGIELLGIIMESYPETVRIILSGHSDKEMILRSVKTTHQFLMKPCDAETIKNTIERACKLRDLLRNETLRKIATGVQCLPSLPSLYGLIIKEMQSPNASLKRVGHIISQDVSMSAKILQLVNSAFFGLPQEIKDPQQAVIYLGLDTLKSLVLSIHVFSLFVEDAELHGFSLAEMWRHSLMTGRLAGDIARAETADEKVAEEALIAGILHDIGKLILLKIPRQYKQVRDFIERTGCDLVEAEYTVMKTSHAELGAYLLGLWGIPDNIVEPVAFHHNPSKLIENTFTTLNKASDKDRGKTKSIGDNDLKIPSANTYLTGFTTLTAVHVANALLMQRDCSFDTTVFPYIDMGYLKTLNLEDKLPEWVGCCNKVRQEEA